jgi:hypothetical protein
VPDVERDQHRCGRQGRARPPGRSLHRSSLPDGATAAGRRLDFALPPL